MTRELTAIELEAEMAAELPQRALMRHHRRHHHHSGNSFDQSNDNSIRNHSQQAATVAGNDNSVNQDQTTVNLIFSNTAGTQQN
jgi:hypothetical protein